MTKKDDRIKTAIDMYQRTKNPLFLWGALFRSLEKQSVVQDEKLIVKGEVTLPAEVAEYLLNTSFRMMHIGWGKSAPEPLTPDWEQREAPNLEEDKKKLSEKMRRSVPQALGLDGRRGTGPFSQMISLARDWSIWATYQGLLTEKKWDKEKKGLRPYTKAERYDRLREIKGHMADSTIDGMLERGEAANALMVAPPPSEVTLN